MFASEFPHLENEIGSVFHVHENTNAYGGQEKIGYHSL